MKVFLFSLVVAALKSIPYADLQTLALSDVAKSESLSDAKRSHLILVNQKDADCSACERLEKTLDLLSSGLQSRVSTEIGSNLTLYKTLDVKRHAPGVMMLRGPWLYDYDDDLLEDKIFQFIEAHSRPVIQKFENMEKGKEWLRKYDLGTVKFLLEGPEGALQNFELIAGGEIEFAEYGYVQSSSSGSATTGTMYLQKWDDQRTIKDIDLSAHQKVYELILKNHLPAMTTLNSISKLKYYFNEDRKGFTWMVYDADLSDKEVSEPLHDVIHKHMTKSHFIHINPALSKHYKDFVRQVLKIQEYESGSTRLVVTDIDGPGRFTYHGDWSRESVNKWFNDIFARKVKVELASEKIPKTEDERLVKELGLKKIVSDEFESIFISGTSADDLTKATYVLIIPSMLCEPNLCENALISLRDLYNDYKDQKTVGSCGRVLLRFTDGQKNEFNPSWHFDLTNTPPMWLIPKTSNRVSEIKKVMIPKEATSKDSLNDWIEKHCQSEELKSEKLKSEELKSEKLKSEELKSEELKSEKLKSEL